MSSTAQRLPVPDTVERVRDHLLTMNVLALDPTPEERLQGIDMLLIEDGEPVRVQVRSQPGEFDQATIELRADLETGRPGWGYSCRADRLALVLAELDLVYWLDPNRLRKRLPEWERRALLGEPAFQRVEQQRGPGHRALELVVPLAALEGMAEAAFCL